MDSTVINLLNTLKAQGKTADEIKQIIFAQAAQAQQQTSGADSRQDEKPKNGNQQQQKQKQEQERQEQERRQRQEQQRQKEERERKEKEEQEKRQEQERKEREEREKKEQERRQEEERKEQQRQERKKREEEKKRREEEEKKRQEEEERKRKEKEERGSLINKLALWVECKIPVYLAGPAGCGKSFSVKKAAELLGLEYYMNNQIRTKWEVEGYSDAAGNYIETEFFRAFTRGGLYFIDEIDSSDPIALVALNNAIANNYYVFPKLGRIEAHPDFRIVAAGNTVGKGANLLYTGREHLDEATLNRFVTINCTYKNAVQEKIGNKELSEFINNLRQIYATIEKPAVVSYRQIEYIATAEKTGKLSLPEIIFQVLFSSEAEDDFNQIIFQIENASGNKYAAAAKEINYNELKTA